MTHEAECYASNGAKLCICDRLRACEQRIEARNQGFADMASFELGKREERKRSAVLIADAYAAGLSAARDAVAALPVALTVVHDTPFLNKQGMSVCENPDKYPHGIVQVAALAAIDALRLDTADCLCPSPNPDCQHPTCPREGK